VHTDPLEYQQTIERLRTELGANAFEPAWKKGRQLTTPAAAQLLPREAAIPASPDTPGSAVERSAELAGLTPRELEVLRLIARGLTIIEAAERLIVSRHTINMHLRSIYNKLGVTTRSAATRYAVENQLI
jgi:DNA-binding CsgD family transcriptional regulator